MMNAGDISFPNLGIYLKNVPQTIQIGGITIAFYGIIIAIGVMAGINMAARTARKNGMDPEIVWDFAIYAVVFSVIGARLYYVLFSLEEYKGRPFDVFNIRQGGLAIYGAVIAAFLTLFVYCKLKKVNPFFLGDNCVSGLVLGQVIGRWGNFMNREVFGEYTNGLLAMRIPMADIRDYSDITPNISAHILEGQNFIQVHPTFLYESLLNLCLFCFMLFWYKRKKFDGEICLLYLGGYGLIRYFVEGIRTDQLKLGNTGIAVSQLLGISLFLFSVVTDVIVRYTKKKKEIRSNN